MTDSEIYLWRKQAQKRCIMRKFAILSTEVPNLQNIWICKGLKWTTHCVLLTYIKGLSENNGTFNVKLLDTVKPLI